MNLRVAASLIALVFASACQGETESMTAGLGTSLKPEGFLVIKDLQPDSSKLGSFLVTCVSSAGSKTTSHTKVEIEQNKVCLPSAAVASNTSTQSTGGGQAPSSGAAPTAQSGTVEVSFIKSSYLKARAGMDVTQNGGSLGVDYCAVTSKLVVSSVCQSSANELKVMGVGISGCDLSSGYLYAPHVQLSVAAAACR